MGMVCADFDDDGDEDLFMTHLMGETNTLYVNDGTGVFQDGKSDEKISIDAPVRRAFSRVGPALRFFPRRGPMRRVPRSLRWAGMVAVPDAGHAVGIR